MCSSATSSSSTCPRRGSCARTCSSSAACSLPAARRSSRCPCSTARSAARGAASAAPLVRLARRPDQGAAFRGYRLTRPRARRRARRRRSPRRRRGRRPVRLPLQPRPLPAARPADDRRRTRRLRRPARRQRRGRLPPAAGRAPPLHPRPAAAQHRHVAALRRRRARPRARRDPGLEGDRARDARSPRSLDARSVRGGCPFRPNLVDWLALAYAAIVLLYARHPAERARRPCRSEGDRVRPRATTSCSSPPTSSGARLAARRPPHALGDRRRRRRSRRLGPDRGLRGPDRVVAPLRAPSATSTTSSATTTTALPASRRTSPSTSSDGLFRRLVSTFVSPLATAYMLVIALLLLATLRAGCADRDRPRRRLRRRPALDVLALVDRRARDRPARRRRRPPQLVARCRRGRRRRRRLRLSPRSSTTSRRAPTGSRPTCPTRRRRRSAKGPLPTGSGLSGTYSIGEPSIRSHLGQPEDGHPHGHRTTRRATASGTRARPRSASA